MKETKENKGNNNNNDNIQKRKEPSGSIGL